MLSEEELRNLGDSLKLSNNVIGLEDFEGYNPDEMDALLYSPLRQECPVRLKAVETNIANKVPLYKIIRHLLEVLNSGKIKPTPSGHLPVELVQEIYHLGYYQDDEVETGINDLATEAASFSILIAHITLNFMKAIREIKGFLVITKKGRELLKDSNALLKEILITYGQQVNLSAFDQFGDNYVGRLGWSFSLVLMHKYGKEPIDPAELTFRYFRAFPALLNEIEEEDAHFCYIFRTVERFMHLLGLVRIEKGDLMEFPTLIQSTPLLYSLIALRAPKNFQDGGKN